MIKYDLEKAIFKLNEITLKEMCGRPACLYRRVTARTHFY